MSSSAESVASRDIDPTVPPLALHARRAPNDLFAVEQLLVFSDAVVAIAMTLLALEIKLPDLPPDAAGEEPPMSERLYAMWPRIVSYLISFAVVGRYWIVHRACYSWITSTDHALVLLELLFLLFVCLVPSATAVLGESAFADPSATVYYSVVVGLVGLAALVMWTYARFGPLIFKEKPLTHPGITARIVWITAVRLAIPPVVFAISIPIAIFVSGRAAVVSWVAMAGLFVAVRIYVTIRQSCGGMKKTGAFFEDGTIIGGDLKQGVAEDAKAAGAAADAVA
ncbi:hypothetical protein DFJ74DRAFT_400080 [Hyaloraphidium curvatum]|nr:hypothetical protein DFJ74DRAFT_400080 [Hyaloraphidium curvatum]